MRILEVKGKMVQSEPTSLQVTAQVAAAGAESAVYDCLV